jgi:DNA-binding NtrC family response regulator
MNKEKKILVIEDAPTQRAILKNLVKELGYEPICPNLFDSSIYQLIFDHNIKIVLLDLVLLDDNGMSVGDGFQICSEIKMQSPDTKVIIITAEADVSAKTFAECQGADRSENTNFIKLEKCNY